MGALPDSVYLAADKLGLVVYKAHREEVAKWNASKGRRQLRHFCGHYWYLRSRGGQPATHGFGPFSSPSAAYAHAITELEQLAASNPRIASVLRQNALLSPSAQIARGRQDGTAHASR